MKTKITLLYFLSFSYTCFAQVLPSKLECQELISNGDFSKGSDGSFTSDFILDCSPNNCDEGEYCIGPNFNTKCNSWPLFPGDHTTGTGDFMMFDGFTSGSSPFKAWETTVNVIPGKSYDFSFYAISLFPPGVGTLALNVLIHEIGVGAKDYLTVISAVPKVWSKQNSPTWTCPSSITSVTLTISQATAGGERDFGIDDISFKCSSCCDFQNSLSNTNFTYSNIAPSNVFTFTEPTGTSGDILNWDFGDGNTATGSNPQNSYTLAGTYLATLTIGHVFPDKDTCTTKLYQLINIQACSQCTEFINLNSSSVAVNMSNWKSANGPITFIPTTSYSPFNVRINWDFDCDGTTDFTSNGNTSVTHNFPCGLHKICYSVSCMQSQQVACSSKSDMLSFNIPCPQNQGGCPNLVTNGDFELGADNSYSSVLTGPLCDGVCVAGRYCIGTSFQSKCISWPTGVDHTSGSGNFMSIDGFGSGTGPFPIWSQSTVLINNTETYKFSVWVKGVYSASSQPQLDLSMEIVQGSSSSTTVKFIPAAKISNTGWTNFYSLWTPDPVGPLVVDLVINQLNSGLFQDFGIDDISFTCLDCTDFMTDAMDFGILGNGVSGNTYQFCLSPNINSNDIVIWDVDCDGSPENIASTSSPQCATYTVQPNNYKICVSIMHVNAAGDTCKVKLNECLPAFMSQTDCKCDSTFYSSVAKCFNPIKDSGLNYSFTPVDLMNNCDSVLWTFGDNTSITSAGNQTVTHDYSTAGIKQVCMIVTRTDVNGTVCINECCLQIPITTLVNEPIDKTGFVAKPNPTYSTVNVEISDKFMDTKNLLKITSMDGKLLMNVNTIFQNMDLNLDAFPAGLYILSLTDKDGILLSKPQKVAKL